MQRVILFQAKCCPSCYSGWTTHSLSLGKKRGRRWPEGPTLNVDLGFEAKSPQKVQEDVLWQHRLMLQQWLLALLLLCPPCFRLPMLGWSLSPGKAGEQHVPCSWWPKKLLSLEWPWLCPKLVSGVDTASTKGSLWGRQQHSSRLPCWKLHPLNLTWNLLQGGISIKNVNCWLWHSLAWKLTLGDDKMQLYWGVT